MQMADARQWIRGRTIGRGSTATVSIATSTPPSGHVFAVKSAELSRSALLQREHAILSSLDHPNIVPCFGFDVSADDLGRRLRYNLFLEYAPGGSIADHAGKLDESAIAACVKDVLHGLAYLHARHLAHCDIKGRNVLLGPDGRAKIADFGCARPSAAAGLPIMGTPMFMAPEVARGEDQGPPADVWALGCMIIEMATGGPPWPDVVGDPAPALHRIGFSSDAPELPRWLSDEAKDFLGKCLRRDAEDRWTAAELLGHSFVAAAANCSPEPEPNQTWVTPKSILEQGFWDAVAEEEEDDDEDEDDDDEEMEAGRRHYSPADRIRQLAGDSSPAASTWYDDDDDGWITVRSGGETSGNVEDIVNSDQIADRGVSFMSLAHLDLQRRDESSVINAEAAATVEGLSDDTTVHGCDPSSRRYYQTGHSHCSSLINYKPSSVSSTKSSTSSLCHLPPGNLGGLSGQSSFILISA